MIMTYLSSVASYMSWCQCMLKLDVNNRGQVVVNDHIAGKFGKFTLFEQLAKSLNNRSAKTLLIVSAFLNDFNLANHG